MEGDIRKLEVENWKELAKEKRTWQFISLDWFVSFRDPNDIWKNHPSYLVAEVVIYICTFLTIIHALKTGGRFIFLWLAIMFHGITVETVSYNLPDIDNFWHGQSMIMFLGKRLPLHVMCLYPLFIYPASVAVGRMKLKSWAEPFAVGLCVVLIDLPIDIIGIKQLWWTWHDTDPNIFDRMYWVPWTSYYFHAAFASSLTFLLRGFRYILTGDGGRNHYGGFFRELLCSIFTGLLSMAFGILQFIPIYHPLHDIFKVPTQICVLLLLSFFFLIVWSSDRNPVANSRETKPTGCGCKFDLLLTMIAISNVSMFTVAAIFNPAEIKAIGLHEKIGPCNETTPVITPIGLVLSKRSFLCTSDYDEGYYDFRCVPSGKPPSDGEEWYTVCGTPYPNFVEYLVVIGGIGLFSLFVFCQLLLKSGKDKPVPKSGNPNKKVKRQ
ncbi:hypothetical protein GQR58_008558 [Nymphon striatum]|nr:hypothetical protein GQR58_008558 [Nymphon striatum]